MKPTKTIRHLAAIGCAAILTAGAAMAQDAHGRLPISVKLDASYLSKYVWRGVVLNGDPVVQPSLTFTHSSGLSYNLWMSGNAADSALAGGAGKFVEHDHTINYPFTVGTCTANVGYIYYAFPNTSFLSTQEFYGSANFGGKLSPALSVNYDCKEIRGAYYALSAGYCCGLPFSKDPAAAMNLSAKIGFGGASYVKRAYVGAPDKAAPLDLVLAANTTFALGKSYTLTPSLAYSTILDSKVANTQAQPNNFIAGLTASSSF